MTTDFSFDKEKLDRIFAILQEDNFDQVDINKDDQFNKETQLLIAILMFFIDTMLIDGIPNILRWLRTNGKYKLANKLRDIADDLEQ